MGPLRLVPEDEDSSFFPRAAQLFWGPRGVPRCAVPATVSMPQVPAKGQLLPFPGRSISEQPVQPYVAVMSPKVILLLWKKTAVGLELSKFLHNPKIFVILFFFQVFKLPSGSERLHSSPGPMLGQAEIKSQAQSSLRLLGWDR